MWKNQGSWNFFHTKLIPNSSIIMKLEEIKLNDDELLVILGGNDDHEQTTYNCGLGCGNGCGNGCGAAQSNLLTLNLNIQSLFLHQFKI